jgi:hypothetical protein
MNFWSEIPHTATLRVIADWLAWKTIVLRFTETREIGRSFNKMSFSVIKTKNVFVEFWEEGHVITLVSARPFGNE